MREYYMDAIDSLAAETGEFELIESILDKYGASEDDSDPAEGYYVSMSEQDLSNAYREILAELGTRNDPYIRYQALIHSRNHTQYELGWIDGFEARDSIDS